MSGRCCIPASRSGRRRLRAPSTPAPPERTCIAAVVAGYETIIRIGLSLQPSHFKRGFQSTGTCDAFGTAAAAGRILFRGKAAEQKILDAIGLAGSYPERASRNSTIRARRASASRPRTRRRCGVAAALLTQQGFSGPADIIEGTGGFARAYADGWDPASDRRGPRHALPSDGRADEIPRRRGAGRGRHRRHAGAAPAARLRRATISPRCISASRASSRAG